MEMHNMKPSTINPLDAMHASLRGLGARSKAISANIANINTPQYKSREISFEGQLQNILNTEKGFDIDLNKTHQKHFNLNAKSFDDFEPETLINNNSFFANGNNVDIDREMLTLSETGLRYKAISKMTRKHFDSMKQIIRGGR